MAAVAKSWKNAFQVLTAVRDYGVGQRVTRGIWSKYAEPSYWDIVRIRPSPDLRHGKVFGRFTFRGGWRRRGPGRSGVVFDLFFVCVRSAGKTDPKTKRINGVLKKDWRLVETAWKADQPRGRNGP